MTLKDLYLKVKEKTLTGSKKPSKFNIQSLIINVASVAFFVWMTHVLWNATANLWKLPELTFIQTASVLFLVAIMKIYFISIGKIDVPQNRIHKGVKENNAEYKQGN